MIYLILIISFLLDYVFLNFISNNSILFPLFTLMSIIIIYSFFTKHKQNDYFIVCILLGILYDVVYTGTVFLNLGLFLLMSVLVKLFFKSFSINLINCVVIGLVLIFSYRLLSYVVMVLSGQTVLSFLVLLKGIYSSIVANLLYIIGLYGVLSHINKKSVSKRFRKF